MNYGGAERFELLKKLREGDAGVQNLMRNKQTGELVTVKFIPRGPKVDTRLEREIMCHRGLSHNNIIKLLEVFLTPEYLGIVVEHASNGEMFEYVASKGTMIEPEARYFFQQLICGAEYCHKMGVVHRDLKLENTLLHIEGNHAPVVKICDFGHSKSMRYHSLPNSTVGTPAYIAPEVFCQAEGGYSGEAADVWSCGVLLYVMLCGCYPFGDPNSNMPMTAVIKRIARAEYSFPPDIQVSPECLDLLRKIFIANPAERISISGIRSHPFFTQDLPWEFQVNAPVPHDMRQSDEETRQIIGAACQPDPSMGVPFWADDIVPMLDIEPEPMELGPRASAGSDSWDLSPGEMQEMMNLMEQPGPGGTGALPQLPQPGMMHTEGLAVPQGLGGMSLAPRQSPGLPQQGPLSSSTVTSSFDPFGFSSSAQQQQQQPMGAPFGLAPPVTTAAPRLPVQQQQQQGSPAGLGGGLMGLGPRRAAPGRPTHHST